LLAQFGDQKPEEKIRILECAVDFALDDDERHMALLGLADYLNEHGSRQRALDLIGVVLKEPDDRGTIRSATILKWEVSRSEDDFQSLFNLMDAEEDGDRRLAAASYLFDQGKPEAALDLLQSLLSRNDPSACLLAAESDIR
jgi:thioredoxin-like negative regulator of GroEL